MYSYCAFSLSISSTIELPQLPPATAGGDVHIRLAPRDPRAGPPPDMPYAYHVTPRLATLDYAGLGTLVVSGGRAITARLLPEADERRLPPLITGAALAILLYQRGLVALQASAVAIHGRAVVLMAAGGQGVAALAAELHRNGHAPLADEITAIDLRARQPVVIPAAPTLLRDARAAAAPGRDPAAPRPLPYNSQELVGQAGPRGACAPVPLAVVYDLHTRGDNNIGYIPLQAGLTAVTRHSYPDCLLQPGGIDHLRQCSRLVGAVAVCELARRLDSGDLPELAQMIESHVATLGLARQGGR